MSIIVIRCFKVLINKSEKLLLQTKMDLGALCNELKEIA